MKTVEEIHQDKKFVEWFLTNGYYVSHYNDVTPVYANEHDDPDTMEIGQRCYTIEQIYELYKGELAK